MQFSIGKLTFRTVLFVAGVILFITGLGYNVLDLNPTGKTDIILIGLGALFMFIALYLKEKHLDR